MELSPPDGPPLPKESAFRLRLGATPHFQDVASSGELFLDLPAPGRVLPRGPQFHHKSAAGRRPHRNG